MHTHTHTPADTHTQKTNIRIIQCIYIHTNSTNVGMHPYAKVINGYYVQTLRIKQTYFLISKLRQAVFPRWDNPRRMTALGL